MSAEKPTITSPQVGEVIATLTKPPISRHTLALYCGASNDHNPMHVDLDFARSAGADDVFAHGMLSMAYLGELVSRIAPPEDIRSLTTRFAAIVTLGAEIHCRAIYRGQSEVGQEMLSLLDLEATDAEGDVKLLGSATVKLNGDKAWC